MPATARVGDSLVTGHKCSKITTIGTPGTDGSVYANSIPIAVVGGEMSAHTIKSGSSCPPHIGAVIIDGSSTVFINGSAVARIGDTADTAGGAIIAGSGNVFTG